MSTDPLAAEAAVSQATVVNGYVEVTIKGGPYAAVTLTSRRDTIEEVKTDLANLIKDAAGAQASLDQAVESAQKNKAPAPGQHGKPAAADKATDVDLPFAEAAISSDPSKCKHGDRTLFEAQSKKGWVCPVAKGNADRCSTVFV